MTAAYFIAELRLTFADSYSPMILIDPKTMYRIILTIITINVVFFV